MEDLKPEETELVGMWLDLGSKVVGDAVSDRIRWLVDTRLTLVKGQPADLVRLYRDPRDGRLWEFSPPFPGGPPQMRTITEEDARERFGSD